MSPTPKSFRKKSGSASVWLRGGLIFLAIAIIVFYTEEDWRGIHAWNRFAREWAAKGEHFDLASRVPPAVPDEQNFALTPVVFSCYGQVLDRTGHEIRPHNTNLVNRLEMDVYNDSISASAQIGNWNEGAGTDLKSWQNYYRTLAGKTNLFPVPPHTQSPAADVLLGLSRYDATIGELRQAAQLPCSRFPLAYGQENPLDMNLPHLFPLNKCARVLQLRAIAELQNNEIQQALDDLKLGLRLADSIRSEPFLESQLSHTHMLNLSLQPLWEGLHAHEWSEAQLVELDAALAKQDCLVDYQTAMHGVMGFQNDLNCYFQKHPKKLYLPYETDDQPPGLGLRMAILGQLTPIGWFCQNRLYCDRCMIDFYLPAADVQKHIFSPNLISDADDLQSNALNHATADNLMKTLWLPALRPTARQFAFAQSSVDMARVAIALERYRLAQGEYPDTLAALSPRYLNPVPHDVIGGQPLHYSVTGDGRFLLYSVGWNEKDDGGMIARYGGENTRQRLEQGDWVWCYPQE